ncbi:Hsp20/alpha crystallin family protein [Candidatus Kaiserbacteria bacterium]|nr:Hsp20/alpha crystallin family protein [Candidatus Kaiserbacteria bacterium]
MAKKSFLSRIIGSDNSYEDDDYFDELNPNTPRFEGKGDERHLHTNLRGNAPRPASQEEPEGELAVDVYQTPDAIIVKTLVAGVQPSTVDIALTREMITISGTRVDEREAEEDDYFFRELYWGAFSRTIILPEEVDVDAAEASEKHGVLMIRLPKVNKNRQTKLKVRAR